MNSKRLLAAGLALVLCGTARADVQVGFLESYDGKDKIHDGEIPKLINLYFEDGSRGNGEVSSDILIFNTTCYAGDHAGNYNETRAEASEGRSLYDPIRFTNTTVVSNDVAGQKTTYHTAGHTADYVARGRTAQEVVDLVRSCKHTPLEDNPYIQGLATRVGGGMSSTHLLIWASRPDLRFDPQNIQKIVQKYPPTADGKTTVTVLAGDGTAAQTGPQTSGVTYKPATREELKKAFEMIGPLMDDGPGEQFQLYILDHGGKGRVDSSGRIIPIQTPSGAGCQSYSLNPTQPMLASIRTNTCSDCQPFLSVYTAQQPGVDFNLMDLTVNLERSGAQPFSLGSPASDRVFPAEEVGENAVPGWELRFTLSQEALFGTSPGLLPRDGISYTVNLENWSLTTPIGIEGAGIFTGAVAQDEPRPPDYSRTVCGNDPDQGCSAPNLYLRMNEGHATGGAGPLPIVDHAGATGETDGYLGFADGQIAGEGPRTPAVPGFSLTNLSPYFNGSAWIRMASQPRLNPTGGFSLSAWVRPDAAGPGTIVRKSDPAGDQRAYALELNSSGELEFRVSQDGRGGPLHETVLTSPQALAPGTWSQVTASLGGGKMGLCIDGRQVAKQTFGVPSMAHPNGVPLWVGTGFSGQIDQLAMHPTFFRGADCEKLADQGWGPISNAFGFPVRGLGSVEIGTDSSGGIEAGPFDFSGGSALSFDVRSADVLAQGFNARIDAKHLTSAGTALFLACAAKIQAIARLLGLAGLQSVGLGQAFVVADFNTLGTPNVVVRVLEQGVEIAAFTKPGGVVASMPLTPVHEVGVLDPASALGSVGYRFHFRNPVAITPSGATGSIVGDEIRVTAPGFSRTEVESFSNVDVLGIGLPRVEIHDAAAGPLFLRLFGDTNGDDVVDRQDIERFFGHLGDTHPQPYLDFDGDGKVGANDLRHFFSRFGTELPAALSAASAGIAGTPVLALETATPALEVGESLELDLVFSGLAGTLGAFALEVSYDSSAFRFDDLSFGGGLGTLDGSLDHAVDPAAQTALFAFDRSDAVVLYGVSLLDESGLAALQADPLALATLEFTAIAPASASFDLAQVDVVDGAQPPGALAPLTQGTQVEVTCENADGDALCNADDNCPFFPTANLADTDQDGRGDECECGDQNGDGQNSVSDLISINVAIFNPDLATPLCDANNDGNCDVNDILAANVEIFSPGTATCERQPLPGP
jgi:hypothetical protein